MDAKNQFTKTQFIRGALYSAARWILQSPDFRFLHFHKADNGERPLWPFWLLIKVHFPRHLLLLQHQFFICPEDVSWYFWASEEKIIREATRDKIAAERWPCERAGWRKSSFEYGISCFRHNIFTLDSSFWESGTEFSGAISAKQLGAPWTDRKQ